MFDLKFCIKSEIVQGKFQFLISDYYTFYNIDTIQNTKLKVMKAKPFI